MEEEEEEEEEDKPKKKDTKEEEKEKEESPNNVEESKEKAEVASPKKEEAKEPQSREDVDEEADRSERAVDPLGQEENRGNVRLPHPQLRVTTPAPFLVTYSITRVPHSSKDAVVVELFTNFNGTSYCHVLNREGAHVPIV